MPVTIRRSYFDNFEALRDVVQDGTSEVVQVGRGKMSGMLTHVTVNPAFGLSTGAFSRGVRLRGVTSKHRWMFGMVMTTEGRASALHRELKPGDLLLIAPGQERYSVYQGATSFATTLIAPDMLEAFLASQPGAQDLSIWQTPSTVRFGDAATATAVVKQMSRLVEALNDPALPDSAADFYRRNIMELVTAPMRDTPPYHGRHLRSALKLVRDVDRYLMEAGDRPVHVSELCEVFKVARRTLFHAFDDVLGIPPITFMRRKRLGEVHAALLRAGPGLTVKGIALAHGFVDLGKFAAAFRRLFGEKPSDTLKRSLVIASCVACNQGFFKAAVKFSALVDVVT